MMDAFDVIEGGCVVAAAAGIAAALRSCKCDEAREFLQDALQVVAQLGVRRRRKGSCFTCGRWSSVLQDRSIPGGSAVTAGSGASAVGSELGSLVQKVGSALVSGSSEPMNQIHVIV